MQILLFKGRSLVSRLIQWQTRSEYSHAAVMFGDDFYIESVEGKGVRLSRGVPADHADLPYDVFTVELTQIQEQEAFTFAADQKGKGYDYTMVARFVTRSQETRASSGKWFCSELVYAICEQVGVNLLRATEPWEVSPGLLARSPFLKLQDKKNQ